MVLLQQASQPARERCKPSLNKFDLVLTKPVFADPDQTADPTISISIHFISLKVFCTTSNAEREPIE